MASHGLGNRGLVLSPLLSGSGEVSSGAIIAVQAAPTTQTKEIRC
jgi:hypothetical protein